MKTLRSVFFTLALASSAVACKSNSSTPSGPSAPSRPTTSSTAPTAPRTLVPLTGQPVAPLPEVQTNAAKVVLGRRLFHDTRLSGDNTLSCASCHSLDHGGAEDRKTSQGIRGQIGPINAPTVLNAGLNFVQFWDGRAPDLAHQAAGPVANPMEMGAQWPQVVEKLRTDERYRTDFAALYPTGITQDNITDAIAEYERSLRTPSRFDRYLLGDASALREDERQGYELFKSLGCSACHSGPGLGGGSFQTMGAVKDYFADRGNPTEADNGRFNVTHQESDRHKFKVPLLRNVALTGPYLHDGSQATLEDVVKVMGKYQLGMQLTNMQVDALVTWLKSLTGELPEGAREPAAAAAPAAAPAPAAH